MLDEKSERRQYLLSSADSPAERPGRLRHHTICDQLSGLSRAMVTSFVKTKAMIASFRNIELNEDSMCFDVWAN